MEIAGDAGARRRNDAINVSARATIIAESLDGDEVGSWYFAARKVTNGLRYLVPATDTRSAE